MKIRKVYTAARKVKKKKQLKRLRKTRAPIRDTENYIPYQSSDKHTEDGFAINDFNRQAQSAELSISERGQEVKHRPGLKKWDRIKKKMVSVEDPHAKKIRTESGVWIPATYKTGRYDNWKQKNKIEEQVHREMGDESTVKSHADKYPTARWKRNMAKVELKQRLTNKDPEMKNPEQIVRQRLRLEFVKNREKTNRIKKAINRKKHARRQK